MARRTWWKVGALLAAMMMFLTMLPATALAAENAPSTLTVGNVTIDTSQDGYWTTDADGNLASGDESNYNVHYETGGNTLTLNGATIAGEYDVTNNPSEAGIYASASADQPVSLTIVLQGENKVSGSMGIYVCSSSTGDASLTIMGGGSLNASGSQTGISVWSNNGDVTLTIENAKVEATGTAYGVNVRPCGSSTASLTVDGGSLTASGSPGILYDSSGSGTVPNTTALTISNSAIVDARGGGIGAGLLQDLEEVFPADDSVGIVFGHDRSDSKAGTVYGDVTLKEDLEIGEGESLTIPDGASLTIGGGATLTNEGTVTNSGTLTNNGTINNSGTLPDTINGNGTVNHAPTITTPSLPDGTVGTAYSATLTADGSPTSWAITDGPLPGGLTLAESTGVISGIPTATGTFFFTVKATNGGGSDSEQLSIVISPAAPSITVQPSSMTVTAGNPADFTVTATGSNLTYRWQQCADGSTWTDIPDATGSSLTIQAVTTDMDGNRYRCVVTGDGGSVTSDVATLTVTAATVPVTGVTLSQTQARLYYNGVPNTISLAATVAPGNATNKAVTWTSSNPAVATVDGNGNVTAVAPGTATISVTTEDGAKTAACRVIVTGVYVPPRPAGPDWDDVADDVSSARPGSTVTVDMDGKTVLPGEMLDEFAGRDVTLALDMGDGLIWEIYGGDVPADAEHDDVDLGVALGGDSIPADVVNLVTGESGSVQVSLEHDGSFGFELTLVAPLGEDAAGLVANLYRYDDETGSLGYEATAQVDGEGVARLPFDHASSWLVALDSRSHALPFPDALEGEWYSETVRWAWLSGLMTGYGDGPSAGLFGTGDVLTRSQLAAVLYNAAGQPEVDPAGAGAFVDCDPAAWYAEAVTWAASQGLMTGYGDGSGRFGPEDGFTREQLAAVFWRAAGEPDADADLSAFPDGGETSAWALEPVEWAVETGLFGGYDDTGELAPGDDLERAQLAAVLMRVAQAAA